MSPASAKLCTRARGRGVVRSAFVEAIYYRSVLRQAEAD